MLTRTFSVHTNREPASAFAYLSDLGNQPQWRHDVLASDLQNGAPGKPGSTWRQAIKSGRLPRPHERLVELCIAQPHHKLAFRTVDDAPIRAEGTYELRPAGTGTTITVTTTLTANGGVGKVALRAVRRHAETTIDRYRVQLERALANPPAS